MKDKQLKNMIKNAYQIEPSLDKKSFVKQYQKRELHMWDILKQQAISIGLINAVVGLVVLFAYWQILMQSSGSNVLEFARISAIMPIIALVAISGMGRSEKYGMDELEMASRFSLRTVLAARLMIVGIIDTIIFLLIVLAFGKFTDIGTLQSLLVVMVPYLITAWGCLFITRKIHSSKDIAVCMGFAGMVALMCVTTDTATPWKYLYMANSLSYMLCVVLIVMFGLEINRLLKGDNNKWNLF